MATKQQLGIELSLTLDSKFSTLIKEIQKSFNDIDLKGFEAKIKGVEGKISTLAEKMQKEIGGSTEKIQKMMDKSGDNKAMIKMTEQIRDFTKITKDSAGNLQSLMDKGAQITSILKNTGTAYTTLGNQIVAIQKNTNKAYSDLGTQINAANQNTEKAHKAVIKGYVEKGTAIISAEKNTNKVLLDLGSQITSINKNTETANKAKIRSYVEAGTSILAAERNTYREMIKERKLALQQLAAVKLDRDIDTKKGSDFLSGLSKQDLKTYNGDVIPKSYITDINRAYDAAVKYNNILNSNKEQLKLGDEYLASLAKQGKAHWNGQEVSAQEYNKRLREMNGETRTLIMSFKDMFKALVEFYMIRGTLFAVSNQFKTAVSELLKFNQALADTAGISNASSASIERFGLSALMIARNSKMNLEEVMKLMNLLAQSGVSEKDVPLVSRVTAMFATGTGSSAENAVRVMTTSLNVWNIEAAKSGVVANTLTAGLNSAKLEVNELSTVFNYLAPMAKQAGYSIQETTAIIATMSQMGVKASTIGTGVGQLLTRLMAPTKGVKDLAAAYNLELDQLNPRLHKFSDIIKTLSTADGGKAIPVQDLLKGFGQIAGRSVSAAVTAGAEYFKEMERNVSLGNASLVAYSKVMEGVGAKMNVLRQTFVQLVGSITSLNGVIGIGYDALLAITRGLLTTEGKALALAVAVTGIATAIYTCRVALKAFVASNPLTIWLSLAGLGLTALIGLFGRVSTETQRAGKEFDKLAKDMGGTQRGFQLLSDLYSKAAEAGELNNDITKEHRTQLIQLVNTTPALHGVIDTSVKKYGELAGQLKSVNGQMEKLSAQNLSAYNTTIDALERAKKKRRTGGLRSSYDEAMSDLDVQESKSVSYLMSRPMSGAAEKVELDKAIAEKRAYFKDQRDKLKDEFRNDPSNRANLDRAAIAQAAITNGMPIDPNKPDDLFNLDFMKYKKGPEYKMKESDTRKTPTPGIGDRNNGHAGSETIVGNDMAAITAKLVNERTKEIEKLSVQQLETNLKLALEGIKGETDPALYAEKKKGIEKLISDLEKETLHAFREEHMVKMAQAVGAEYDPAKDKFRFPNTPEGKLKFKQYTKYNEDNPGAFMKGYDQLVASKGFTTSAGTDLKNVKIPEITEVAEAETRLTSASVEKQLGIELGYKLKSLAIRKEEARTSTELRELGIESLELEQETLIKKTEAFQKDLDTLNTRSISRDLTKDELQQYELIVDKLHAVEDQIDAIGRKKKEQADTGILSNFKKGASKGLIGMGDVKSNSEQLGLDVANTGLNGMVTLLDESISKLAKLEWSWKSFRDTLGSVMKDIAAELQKYLVKLFVIWMVEKALGWATAKTTTSPDSLGGMGTLAGGEYSANSGGLLTSSGFIRLNGGGQVPLNMGTPGQDSILTYLTPGEIVINKPAVDEYGADYFLAHNKVQRLAEGGMVGAANRSSAAGSGSGGTIQIINIVDPASIPQTTDAQIINVINLDIIKRGPTIKTIKTALGQ